MALPDPSAALALVKPAVRAQPAYTLVAPAAGRMLNLNESPYDFPPALKREVLARVEARLWQRYPELVPAALHERLAAYYGWRGDGVLVGNGSNELIQAALAVALAPGDAVVAPAPTFSVYRLLTAIYGGRYVPVPLGPDYAYDVDALVRAAARERAKVVVLNSPNNPTGSVAPPGTVERLLGETDALILCDEAYQDFGGPTAIPLLRRSARVVVLRTFSKAFGMAGLRCGLALAHPALAAEIAKAKLPYNVNMVTLAAAEAALDHASVLEERTRAIVAARDAAAGRLANIPGLVVYPSAANFFLVRCTALPAREVFRRLLEEHDILVRDLSGSSELAGCLRISVGTPGDMAAVAAALETILAPAEVTR
jgi:histidinol-phosphate aminotransferase